MECPRPIGIAGGNGKGESIHYTVTNHCPMVTDLDFPDYRAWVQFRHGGKALSFASGEEGLEAKHWSAEELNSSPDTNWPAWNQEFLKIVEGMEAWVQVCDLEGTVDMVNAAASRISGYRPVEMVGQPWPYPWLSVPWVELTSGPYAELRRVEEAVEFETECIAKNGNQVPLSVSLTLMRDEQGRPEKILMVAWDLKDRIAAEAETRQAQKIQAVSQLAAGVAHDINNNLAVILGYAEFLLGKYETFNEDFRQALNAIRDQSMDCANTVRRIQLFSKPVARSQMAEVAVNDVVQEVVKQVDETWSRDAGASWENIAVRLDLAPVTPVWGYRAGLRDALRSLVNNAADALPKGGVITIQTRQWEDRVEIKVTDNGVGIAPAHLSRIFDPFFTTKGPATSGLGLSIAYNLITQQSGAILVDSEPGQGATFTIQLPVMVKNRPPAETDVLERDERCFSVLVVDDEPLVAEVIRTFLESFGQRVVTCGDGQEALEALSRERFDLGVIDLGMEDMDGWELTGHINRKYPDFPIVLATGWAVTVDTARDRGVKVSAVLKKPFGMAELCRVVEKALGVHLSEGVPLVR